MLPFPHLLVDYQLHYAGVLLHGSEIHVGVTDLRISAWNRSYKCLVFDGANCWLLFYVCVMKTCSFRLDECLYRQRHHREYNNNNSRRDHQMNQTWVKVRRWKWDLNIQYKQSKVGPWMDASSVQWEKVTLQPNRDFESLIQVTPSSNAKHECAYRMQRGA